MTLEDIHAVGSGCWPDIDIGIESLAAMAHEVSASPEGLRARAGDFYLACAAGCGLTSAIATIDRLFVVPLNRRLRRVGSTPAEIPDALQVVRERLFAGPRPRIKAYNASAPLEAWIRVVGIRVAIDLRRSELSAHRGPKALRTEPEPVARDPATTVVRTRYQVEFERVLRMKLAELPARERNVLRLHVIEGVSIEKVALAHGVHRGTVARWVWNAGQAVMAEVRRHFAERHGIIGADFDSVAHLLRSQISLSVKELQRS
jgi:RNA polymerase sigma-70 factor (ECF subfamily)